MKLLPTVFLLAILCLVASALGQESKSVLRVTTPAANTGNLTAISDSDGIVAVLAEDYDLRSNGTPKIIVALWPNGRIVWSEDRIRGGAPYFTASVEPQLFTKLMVSAREDDCFAIESLGDARVRPDAKFTSILLKDGKSKLRMSSWHEVYQSDPKIIATSAGISRIKGNRLIELANDKPEYIHYRLAWAELRLAISRLIPVGRKRVDGDVIMKSGKAYWRQDK